MDNNLIRVGFYVTHDFHHAMLNPIYDILKNELLCLMTADYKKIVKFQPGIIVLANHPNAFFRKLLPETIIIWTRHGFSSKNYLKPSLEWCDFACVSSEWVRDDLIKKAWFPRLGYWVTGFPAMDSALQTNTFPPKPIENLITTAPTLLYAPSFTPNFTAIEVLGSDWIKTLRLKFPQMNIIIKLHPHTATFNPNLLKKHEEMAQGDQQTYLIEANANIYDYMKWTDILLTDVSSVMFYFLAFNRPIILVNNPNRFKNKRHFDNQAPEWTWRDMGIEVDSVPDLLIAIENSLQEPAEKAKQRIVYRQRVYGNLDDGNASARIANKIRALAQANTREEWVQIAWNSIKSLGQLERQLSKPLLALLFFRLYNLAKITYRFLKWTVKKKLF